MSAMSSSNYDKQYKLVKSRISPEETQQAVNKLLYEISQRKNEFVALCTKEDLDFSSKLPLSVFRRILNQFTIYPSNLDKEIILNHYTINDDFIDYIAISNQIPQYNIQYLDPLLHHLNQMNKAIDNKALQVTTSRVGKIIDLSPIEKLNCQLNEENFMIKNAKDIMSHVIKSTSSQLIVLLNQCDYDNDGKFSIGELKEFLESCNIFLGEYDLRFFFEYFPRISGKVAIETFETYINNNYQKQYEQTARTEFVSKEAVEAVEKQEMKDEHYYDTILRTNYLISIIKECLLIFGKEFLMKYFSKSFEFYNNKFYIFDDQLVVGLKLLGYKEPIPGEIANFKLYCIHKQIAIMNNEKKIKINIEVLFNGIIDYFQMTNQIHKCTSEELVQGMSSTYFKLMNEMFLNTVTDKINNTDLYQSQINEFQFRKKFIRSFGFIDHDFFDYTIKNINKANDQLNQDDDNNSMRTKATVYNLKKIDAKTYIELAYNITFMSMLRNSSNIGLLIEPDDVVVLNQIYNKMEQKIFQQHRIVNKVSSIIDIYKNTLPKRTFEGNFVENNQSTLNKPKESNSEFIIGNYKESSIKIKESICNIIEKRINNNIDIGKVIKLSPKEVVADPIEVIPKLFGVCRDYLVEKYKLDCKDNGILFNIGICRIFRDQLIKQGFDIKNKIHYTIFLNAISNMCKYKEVYEFLCEMIRQQKDSDGYLNIQFIFSKIEEILLHYYKAYLLNDKINKVN